MPNGKPAGVACVHLTPDQACHLWGDPGRPRVCAEFLPEPDICGRDRDQALRLIAVMEE